VAMTHTDREGNAKLLKNCNLPLTGVGCVRRIVSDLAVVDVTPGGFKLIERAPGVTVDEIVEKTGANLIVDGIVPEMVL
jgi:3-oxoacid CoA-transferase subunit B